MSKRVDNFKHFDILFATVIILVGCVFLIHEYHGAFFQHICNGGAAIFTSIHGFLKNRWLTLI